jgi:hypothetical protein
MDKTKLLLNGTKPIIYLQWLIRFKEHRRVSFEKVSICSIGRWILTTLSNGSIILSHHLKDAGIVSTNIDQGSHNIGKSRCWWWVRWGCRLMVM